MFNKIEDYNYVVTVNLPLHIFVVITFKTKTMNCSYCCCCCWFEKEAPNELYSITLFRERFVAFVCFFVFILDQVF